MLKIGTECGVQKHMNGQVTVYTKVVLHPEYFPVVQGLNVVVQAQVLGITGPEYPLCVNRDKDQRRYPVSH